MTRFSTQWNLPWKAGSYHRTTVFLNPNAEIPSTKSLVPSYSQKAVFLANVENRAAWYVPTESSVTKSRVFAPESIADLSETPVAFAKSGKGWVGYIGDVNYEEDTDNVVLGMLGVLESSE